MTLGDNGMSSYLISEAQHLILTFSILPSQSQPRYHQSNKNLTPLPMLLYSRVRAFNWGHLLGGMVLSGYSMLLCSLSTLNL